MSARVEMVPRLRPDVSIRPFEAREGSGCYVVAVDERHFVVSRAVAAVLEATREPLTLAALTERLRAIAGVPFTESQARALLEEKIPRVVFEAGPGTGRSPLLWQRRLFEPPWLARPLALLAPLMQPVVAIPLIALYAMLMTAVLVRAGSSGSVLEQASGARAFALVLLGMLMHELGHLSACRRFGARHGGIGVGLYWFLPVFYAEVSGAWMLERRQRAAIDAAGLYLQSVFLAVLAVLFLARPSATLLMAIWWSHFLMLHTLNPVLKYDGYWLLSDLTGCHNLHRRIREHARAVYKAVLGTPRGRWPSRAALGLFVAFLAIATLHFGYAFHLLGEHLGYAGHAVARAFAEQGPAWEVLRATGLLLLLAVVAVGIATMLAGAIGSVWHERRASTGEGA